MNALYITIIIVTVILSITIIMAIAINYSNNKIIGEKYIEHYKMIEAMKNIEQTVGQVYRQYYRYNSSIHNSISDVLPYSDVKSACDRISDIIKPYVKNN